MTCQRYVSWAVCAGIMAICNGVWTTYKQNVITTADTLGIVSREFDNKYGMLCDASPRHSLSMGSSTMASRVMSSCNRQGEFYCMMSDGLHTTVPCDWEVYKHNVFTLVVPTSMPQYYVQNCIQLPRRANCYWILHVAFSECELPMDDDDGTPPPRRNPTPVLAIKNHFLAIG